MQRVFILLITILAVCSGNAQKKYSIPAYTAYAMPVEKEEDILFNKKDSSLIWNDSHQKIEFHFNSRKQDSININLFLICIIFIKIVDNLQLNIH